MKPPPMTGPVFRVAAALLLCAACFQAGRWYQELAAPAAARATARYDPGDDMGQATFLEPAPALPQAVEPAPLVAAGDPVGQSGDIITPLYARDPSALVMGPYQPECRPPETAAPSPRAKAAKPLKSGRLLELLRKGEKTDNAPKNY